MYNQTNDGYGQTLAGAGLRQGPPRNVDRPSGIVEQAVGMVSDATQQIVAARIDLSRVGDRLLGSRPECETGDKCANPLADGHGHQLLGNINALHREIAALRAEITRLEAL